MGHGWENGGPGGSGGGGEGWEGGGGGDKLDGQTSWTWEGRQRTGDQEILISVPST